MMSDYDRTLELQEAAYNSVGQSTIQFNKYQDTVEYKINQIKNSWERLRVSLLDQNVYKGALDKGNQLLSSIKEDFSLKDLAFIGIIGLTVGRTFVTQMIKGIQTNTNTMFTTIQSQMNNIANKAKLAISKIQIGDKTIRIPVHIDTTQMKQEITDTSTQIKNQLSLLSSDIQKNLLTINSHPINLTGLAEFNQMLSAGKTTAELSDEAIIKLYQQMGQTGTITAGTQAFNNFKTQLELIETELLRTSGNENLTASQASELKEKLEQLTTQTQQLTQAEEANTHSTSKMGKAFSAIGSAVGQNLGLGITSGITTYLATGDLKQSLQVGLVSIITSVASTYLPKLITLLFSNPVSAIITIVVAAVVGIITIVGVQIKKHWNKVHEPIIESLEKTTKEAKDRLEKITENTEIAISTAKADKESIKTIEELKENYDELSKKVSLTEEEQTKWQETISTINDQYGDTVLYYDEMNNKLVLSESLWAKMEEEARSMAEVSQQIATLSSVNQAQAQYDFTIANSQRQIEQLKNSSGLSTNQKGDLTTTKDLDTLILAFNKSLSNRYTTSNDKEQFNDFNNLQDKFLSIYDKLMNEGEIQAFDVNTFLSYMEQSMNNGESYEKILQGFNDFNEDREQDYEKFYHNEKQDEIEAIEQIQQNATEEFSNTISTSVAQNLNTGSDTTNRIVSQQVNNEAEKSFSTGTDEQTQDRRYIIEGFKTLKLDDSTKESLLGIDYENLSDDEIIANINNALKNIDDVDTFKSLFGNYSQTIAEAFQIDLENFSTDNLTINDENTKQLANIGEQLYKFNTATQLSEQVTEDLKNEFDSLYDSGLSLQERLQKINDLMNENPKWSSGIESEKENLIDTYLPGYVDVNENGQITGGLFSNIITDADMASGLAEALQNEDFSTVQKLLVKKLGNNGRLLANVLANVDEATISSISSFIADNFTGDEAQAKAQIGFQKLLEKMTTGDIDLEDNELSILLNSGIDFSTNNSLTDDTLKKQAAEALYNASGGALSYEKALQKVNNVYSDLIKIVGEFQYGSESAFNTLISGSQAASEELKNQSDALFTILDDYNAVTGLTREQINQLNEVGLQDIYKLSQDTGTVMLDLSKVTETFSNNTKKTAEALQKELTVEKANIAILEQRKANMEELGKDTTEITKQINEANKSYQDHTLQAQQEISLSYQENISYLQKYIDWLKNLQDAADEAQEALKKAQEEQQKAQKELNEIQADLPNKVAEAYKEEAEAIKEAQEAAEDAYESLQDAYDSLQDAQEALADANKELYEAIHGTEDYTTGLERMYNASRRIDTIDKRLENLKETMENATNSNDIVKATEDYINMAKEKVNVLTAMNQADQQTLNNMMNDFLNNSSYDALKQFFKQTENGIEIDMQGIENADANDEIKNAAIEWAEQYNEIFDNILDRNDEISEAQKIMKDYYKTALDGYVSLQEKVADILKENAEEEISITEEKYASMKEADDAYLDALESAINKQRELREQANQYEDLATQEKKLALLSRDTSGANQKQVLELQQEVETSRTEILDAEIDNFLESMRELYETQQEARDAEIEYLNALMESTNWWTKTNELLSSFENADDYKTWLMENDTSFGDMSVEQQEQYLMEAETDYNAIPQFDAAKIMMEQWGQDLGAMIQADVDEVNRIVNELGIDTAIGDQILTAGEVARDEMIKTAEESVASAEQAVIEAQQNVLDM